jgi:hypothetical protein
MCAFVEGRVGMQEVVILGLIALVDVTADLDGDLIAEVAMELD